jgi:lipoprotein
MNTSIKRISALIALSIITTGCSSARINSKSIAYAKFDLSNINGKTGDYIHNLNQKAKLTYSGNEKITGDGLTSFRYSDYDGKTYTELFPTSGRWDRSTLNSNKIKIDNNEFKLNFDVDLKSDVVQLSYFIQDGVFSLVYWGNSDNISYNIYKNGILLANTKDTYFNDFSNNGLGSLVKQGNEIIAKQNDGLNIADTFYVRPVLSDGSEGAKSNTISIKDVASDIPIEIDDDTLKLGIKANSPKDLPREVEVKLLNGGSRYYNIDYRLDEATRFTDKIYYRYYVNNTKLKGFVEVNLLNSFSIPSSIENGEIESQETKPFKLTVLDQKDGLDLTLVNLDNYIFTSSDKINGKLKVYEDLSNQLNNKATEVDLSKYSLDKQSFVDVAEQLELDYYYIIDSITLDRKLNKLFIKYNDNDIQTFDSIDSAYKFIAENNMTNDKEISSLVHLSYLSGAYSVKGNVLGNIRYFNIIKIDNNYYNIDFSSANKSMFMCSDEQAFSMGYAKNKSFIDYKCSDGSKEYYLSNNLVANNLDEYSSILNREIANGSYNISVKYLGDRLTSSQIIDAISSVFSSLNKRDLLSRVKFADSNNIYTIRIGE